MDRTAFITATLACVAAAMGEALGAGRTAKERMLELRMPRLAPPLVVWFTIGGLYYVICFGVLYRLLAARQLGLPLVMALLVMIANTLWTFAFFRKRDLLLSSVIAALYVPIAIGLFAALWQRERTAAWIFLPYMIYLVYGTYWSYGIWRLNRVVQPKPG